MSECERERERERERDGDGERERERECMTGRNHVKAFEHCLSGDHHRLHAEFPHLGRHYHLLS